VARVCCHLPLQVAEWLTASRAVSCEEPRREIRLVPCAPTAAEWLRWRTRRLPYQEQHFLLSNLSPSLAQRRLALAVVLALLAAFVITPGPMSRIQPGRIGAFVPAYATGIFVTDLLTAALLFAQFSIQ
jgi:hypothetical protein